MCELPNESSLVGACLLTHTAASAQVIAQTKTSESWGVEGNRAETICVMYSNTLQRKINRELRITAILSADTLLECVQSYDL